MNKIKSKSTLALLCLLLTIKVDAQRLDKFASSSKKQTIFATTITYFGYVQQGATPDAIRDTNSFFFLYCWIPDSFNEIGVRMVSPVPLVVMPDRGDQVSETYYENESDKKIFFDPVIFLERANNFNPLTDSVKKHSDLQWILLGYNNDSQELFEQPSGKNTNALLRILSDVKSEIPKLVPGLYRIAFTSPPAQKWYGGYVFQLGIDSKIKSLKVASTMSEFNNKH